MPLHPISLKQGYVCVFGTLGPVKEEWGDDILQFIDHFWKNKAIMAMAPRLKFEVSDDKQYPHFHLGLMFIDRQKYAMFIRAVQKFMSGKYKNEKPSGYSKEKGFSFRLFAVPYNEDVRGIRLTGKKLIDHYLDEPTKEKSTDGKNYTIELTGFNVAAEVKRLTERDPEYGDKLKKWLSKFAKYKWGEYGSPPLDKRFLGNLPNLDHVNKHWAYLCRKGETSA